MPSDSPSPDKGSSPKSSGSDSQGRSNNRTTVKMGKYEVVKHIATGGMGSVYRALDTQTGREVALKVLPHDLASKPMLLERFKREARSAEKLKHENIVALLDWGEFQGTHFIAMEFVDGIDLHDYLKRNGPLSPEDARLIILQAARALRTAHSQNIVHRDIKPSNFLVTNKNGKLTIKLTDFGLARDIDSDESRVTKAGTTVGTVDYISPEQARDSGAADIRSDLYSLGSTWYHLLCGHCPFPDGGISDRLVKITQAPPPDIRDINPQVDDETWEVIEKLLAKRPGDRYQTPQELIEALLRLEEVSDASRDLRSSTKKAKRNKKSTSSRTKNVDEQTDSSEKNRGLWYSLAGIAALVLVGGLYFVLNMPRETSPLPPETGEFEPVEVRGAQKGELVEGKGKEDNREKDRVLPTPVVKQPSNPETKPPAPQRTFPLVSELDSAIDLAQLRKQVDAPWNAIPSPAESTSILRVRRATTVPGEFRSLAEALAKAPVAKPVIIEIHDNGPLVEIPPGKIVSSEVVIRAAKGYRPLILWDLPSTVAKNPGKPNEPVVFFRQNGGRLWLQGLEIAWRWPETLARLGLVFDLHQTSLDVQDCIFSGMGKPSKGFTLFRLQSAKQPLLTRWTRSHIRGGHFTALDLTTDEGQLLIDGCLLIGQQVPLFRFQPQNKPLTVSMVRSTLVASHLVEMQPVGEDLSPGMKWLCWDSILSRNGGDGVMLQLASRVDPARIEWKAVNSLYAGWTQLLVSKSVTLGSSLAEWRRHWAKIDCDHVVRDPWPDLPLADPGIEPQATFLPTNNMKFGATISLKDLIGCDLQQLPPSRDHWVSLLDPSFLLPELLTDDSPPTIPGSDTGLYTGEALNLDGDLDLGAYLNRKRPAEKVVLHLSGKGKKVSSPIRLKGTTLVLHFAPPADSDTPRLELEMRPSLRASAFIDIEKGSLDIINGVLAVPELGNNKVTHVLRVAGGDIRLLQSRIKGPQQVVPEGYLGAIQLEGSGDPVPDRARICVIKDSVLLSSKAGIILSGVGCKFRFDDGVVVAGTNGLRLLPGKECRGRVGQHCYLSRVTFAARESMVHLGDAPQATAPVEPAQIVAGDCAYLNPFPSARAGILSWEGDALHRGLLMWNGEQEGYDRRLFYAASKSPGEKKEGWSPWLTLWPKAVVRRPQEVAPLLVFDPRRWPLERLALKMPNPPGANLDRLGLIPKKKR